MSIGMDTGSGWVKEWRVFRQYLTNEAPNEAPNYGP